MKKKFAFLLVEHFVTSWYWEYYSVLFCLSLIIVYFILVHKKVAVFNLYNFEQHCPEDNQSLLQCFVPFYLIIGLSDQSMFFSPAQSDPSSLMIAYIFYPKMSFKWSFNALFLLQSLENWQTLLINVCVHTVYHKIIIPSFVFLAESKHWVNPLDVEPRGRKDFLFLLQSPEDEQTLLVLFAVVHLFAMSSACANPVLYGFLNENFKQVSPYHFK